MNEYDISTHIHIGAKAVVPEQAGPKASQEVPVGAKGELHSGSKQNS